MQAKQPQVVNRMEHIYYIVKVHDIGEILDYEFSDLAKAQYLMSIERLECSLWECNRKTGTRLRLDARKAAS